MPRGVVIPEVRQQFFAALERLIAAEGPSGLTGRAVTRAAGVATGLLNAHFRSWDGFLTGYAVDRSFQLAAGVAHLAGRAGTATVAANVTGALLATPLDTVVPLVRLLAFRADLTLAVEGVLGPDSAGLAPVERALSGYLAAEGERVRSDPAALALALTGVLQRLALSGAAPGEIAARLGPVAGQLVSGPQPTR